MRCQTCDYSLWNLARRDCPECGSAFKPSDFEFQPNAVQFCCPHCEQVYYGDGPNGHLMPMQFDCVQCGEFLTMDAMVLRAADGYSDDNSVVTHNPWLRRKELGQFRGWISAVGQAIGSPGQLIKSTPANRDTNQAMMFAIRTIGAYLLVGLGTLFVAQMVIMTAFTAGMGGGMRPSLGVSVFWLFFIGLSLIGMLVGIVVWAAVTHGILRLTGHTQTGLHRTLQAICYSSACNLPMAIPLLGFYLQPLNWAWWMINATLMVKDGQKVSGVRATMATLIPPGIVLGAITIAIIMAVMSIMQGVNAATANMTTTTAQTSFVQESLKALDLYWTTNDAWPDHGAMLLDDPTMTSAATGTAIGSATMMNNVPVGNSTLGAIQASRDADANRQAIADAAAALPDDVIAHRLSDVVYTYHGVDADADEGDLWLVVYWPDPDQTVSMGAQAQGMTNLPWPWQFSAGEVDGDVTHYSVADVQAVVDEQNELREAVGLAPLPLPEEVTHDKPAVAGE